MLARKRKLVDRITGKTLLETPLLLPSFSSKIGLWIDYSVQEVLDTSSEYIYSPILISAYDIHYGKIASNAYQYAPAIFLDSGGYEVLQDTKMKKLGFDQRDKSDWNYENYSKIISEWDFTKPTVIISYDHPDEHLTILEQIKRAKAIPQKPNVLREILIKPEPMQKELDEDLIISHAKEFQNFDIIGLTEKELGGTYNKRFKKIAAIRRGLILAGLEDLPIHIFGSLDTLSTPLYFVAGADIFDGLTWIKFGYFEGLTIYNQNYSAVINKMAPTTQRLEIGDGAFVDIIRLQKNYFYTQQLQEEMESYANTALIEHSFIKYADVIARVASTVKEGV